MKAAKSGLWKNDYDGTRRYRREWEIQFKWLTLKDGHCFCKWCDQFISKKSFKKHRLTAHEKREKHKQMVIHEQQWYPNNQEQIEYQQVTIEQTEYLHENDNDNHFRIIPIETPKTEFSLELQYKKEWEQQFKWLTLKDEMCYCTWCESFIINKDMKKAKLAAHNRTLQHKKFKPAHVIYRPQPTCYQEEKTTTAVATTFKTLNSLDQTEMETDNAASSAFQPNNEERIINDVTSLFTCDVHRMFKDDPAMRDLLVSNPELQNTAAGIGTLTKLLIGELAQKYLKENLMKLGTNSNPPEENLKSQIGEVEKKILEATTMLEKLKGKLPGTGGDTVIEISPEAFEEIPM